MRPTFQFRPNFTVYRAPPVVGGAALPWLAGAAADGVGAWTLLPFALTLGVLQLVVWWRIVLRLRAPSPLRLAS